MSRTLVFTVAALVADAARAQATVTALDGSAFRVAGSAETALKVGDAVAPGEAIRVGPDGRVEAELPDGSVLRLGPDSQLRLDQAGFQTDTQSLTFRARMLAGRAWAEVVKLVAGGKFEVETDNGVAGVRGTEFVVEVNRSAGESIEVHDGEVFFATRLALNDALDRDPPRLLAPAGPSDEGMRVAMREADAPPRAAGAPARAAASAPAGPSANAEVEARAPAGDGVLLRRGQHLRIERGAMFRYRAGTLDRFGQWVRERQKLRPRLEHPSRRDHEMNRRDRIHRDRRERRDLRRERLRDRLFRRR